ncbi:MAG: hypothetical protein K2Q18_01730, partial [Bdellovibrionales bacterium]|nr:hypothetical protein [Bdellovibrionales bacterium]
MKKIITIIMFSLLSINANANLNHAPSNFSIAEGKVVFVDFIKADYDITYDGQKKIVSAISKITFETNTDGMPLFDVVENPIQVTLDGEVVQSKLIKSPDQDTSFRVALKT